MTTIATLAVRLIGDIKEYTSAMNQAEQKAQKTASEIGKNLQNAGKSITSLGQRATVGLTLPLIGLGAYALNAASDLEETKNKVSVVFGDMSDSVLSWSQDSATALGQSRQQALEAAGTYGNLFLTLGLGQKPAADMSTQLVGLASDLASFNNANPEDVLEALRSGLVGQSEPMRKFGVNLSEAAVQAKAMEMGLADSNGELSEAAKVQARFALILAQTTTAQGDFARTSDGLANSSRIMKAQLADTAATLGQQLLPYALQFVQFLSGLINKFQQLSPEQQKWILIIGGAVAVAGPLLMIIGSLVSAIGALIPIVTAVAGVLMGPLGIALLLIVGLVALLYLAWTNNWGGIREKTAAAWAFIKNVVQEGWAFVQAIFEAAMTVIKPLMAAFTAALQGNWYAFGQNLRMAWDAAWRLIGQIAQNAWNMLRTAFSNLITNIINFFRNTDWGQVGRNMLEGIARGITGAISIIRDAAIRAVNAAMQAMWGFLGISSPSRVMQFQVGLPMAQGIAEGFGGGLDKLIPPVLPNLMPAVVPVTPAAASVAPQSAGGLSGDNSVVVRLLEEIASKDPIDVTKLSRAIRDVMLQVQK